MKQISSKNHSIDQSNPVCHDTYWLLRSYRGAVWNLESKVQHVKRKFEIEYESGIGDFLEPIYLAGTDLNGSKLESYAKGIERNNQMLSLLNSAVETLRNKRRFGEQYCWILYYTYLPPQQLQNADKTIDKLCPHIANISYHTYYREYPQTIEVLSRIPWEYTIRNCPHIVNQFFPDN